jgi:hypothetical protein
MKFFFVFVLISSGATRLEERLGERVPLLLLWKDLPQLSPILGKIVLQLSQEGEDEFEIH